MKYLESLGLFCMIRFSNSERNEVKKIERHLVGMG